MAQMKDLHATILKCFWQSPDSLRENLSFSDPRTLFHYTSIDTAISILGGAVEDRCGFAFTHYKFLNDSEEFDTGVKLALSWLKDTSTSAFFPELAERIKHYLTMRKKEQCLVPYVLSFSTEPDSTVQWMAYTDKHNGGLAIGLDYRSLTKEVDVWRKKDYSCGSHARDEYMLAPCIYYSKEQIKTQEEKWIWPLRNVFNLLFGESLKCPCKESIEELARWSALRIFQFAALLKRDDYRFEHEWRLVIRPELGDYIRDLRFIGGKPRLVPDALNLKSCVSCVIRSPHGDVERLKLTAELMRLKLGMDFRVAESSSSYQGA